MSMMAFAGRRGQFVVDRARTFRRGTTAGKVGEVVLVTMAFTVGLPAALAILPQTMEVSGGCQGGSCFNHV